MGFCIDREDINFFCMIVVQNFMERNNFFYDCIGWLEVGIEIIIDKLKFVKINLMQLFEEFGNIDIEGIDIINVCYGGIVVVFNVVNWIEFSFWDGWYVLVVVGDIVVYVIGNVRFIGGVGVVVLLIGLNVFLIFE